MEAILELDDDIFYKDLSNQISLLIMDDDDEDSFACRQSLYLESSAQETHPYSRNGGLAPSLTNNYEHQQINQRESKGTGVFIPRSLVSNHRKKGSKKGRKSTAYSGNKSKRACCTCTHHNSVPRKSIA